MNSNFDFDLLTKELDSIIDIDMEEFGFDETTIDWDNVEDLSHETYEQPTHNMLECPKCHHIDRDIHFKKVDTDIGIEQVEDSSEE